MVALFVAGCPFAALAASATPAQWAQARVARGEASAVVVVRIEGGQVAVAGHGRRPARGDPVPDGDTRFRIGSLGAVFTHLLLAERVADGAVRYGQSLGGLLPDTVRAGHPQVAAITLKALATGRSGLPRGSPNLVAGDRDDSGAVQDEQALWTWLASARTGQPLGSYPGQSDLAVALLGQLLARQAGSGFHDMLDERVIEPLHLRDTGRQPDDNATEAVVRTGRVDAAGNERVGAVGLWSSANDLARLVQVYLGEHAHAFRHFLADDLEIAVADPGGTAATLVWQVTEAGHHPIFWHGGGTDGYRSFVGFRPDTRAGIVMLVHGGADPTPVGLAALGYTRPAVVVDEPDRRLSGDYRVEAGFDVGIRPRAGVLTLRVAGRPAWVLHPLGEDWYALNEVDASVHFVRGDAGAVEALELVEDGVVYHARRITEATAGGEQSSRR